MQQIADWLKKLGMAQYAQAFADNDIDFSVLRYLTDQHLKDLGVSLGHRLKMLQAIHDLGEASAAATASSAPTPTEPTRQADAERRQLTVMFTDLVGSTALSARLDPEDMREIIGAYHCCCADQISKAGGFVAKYMGDGVLAYFGYPQAHEDDAERAIRAALSLTEAVPKLHTGRGAALQVRIGIATGLVVVGDLIGEGDAQERGVVGEAPNIAARLQALAEAGHVVISNSTRRLTGGMFEYGDLSQVTLKGLTEPVQAWRVTRVSEIRNRFEAQHESGLTPLIGREEELELLLRRWQRAKSGEGQVVLLLGEPGIGKSRLTVALAERLQAEPHTRLRYFCSPHHTDSAFYPVIARLERAAGFDRHDTADAKLTKLTGLLRASAGQGRDIQLLAELLSIPTGDRYAPMDWSAQRKKNETLEAFLRQLEMLSRQRPVQMIYEDVHWIDPSTRELLDITVERVARLRVLLVIIFRPEFQPPWIGQVHVSTINLGRLGRREGSGLAERVADKVVLSDEVMAEIVERSDGIPLFVEELTKAVVEAGADGDAARRTVSTVPHPKLTVPATLHASLMARLDRLGPGAKEIAQIGACIGREFSYEVVASVAGKSETGLRSALGVLSDAGLVSCRGTPPQATFLFKHALVRDAGYASLLRGRRQQLHGRIASTLEENHPETVISQPEMLAHHFEEAGLVERAVAYRLKAGQRAAARYAVSEAIMHLRKGIGLLANLPETGRGWEHELDLQIALGRALVASEGWASAAARKAFKRAQQLCEQLNAPRQLVLQALNGQFAIHFNSAEFQLARQCAEKMLQLGMAHRDVTAKVFGYRYRGHVCMYLGELAAARINLQRSLALYDPTNHALYATLSIADLQVLIQCLLSGTVLHLGYPDQARALQSVAVERAQRLGHPLTLAFALCWFLRTELVLGTNPLVEEASLRGAEELESLAAEQQLISYRAEGNVLRGCCLTALGRTEDGLALVRDGLAKLRSTETARLPFTLLATAEALGTEQSAVGLKHLDELAELIETTQARLFLPHLEELRGRLLISMQDTFAAEAALRNAAEVARDQCAKTWELRASTSLARLWRDQGKRTQARDLLTPIYGWFTEGFDTPVLKDAKALLDELAT
jgi:class 3 adenylate cyclase/tetratricopeptide (TPR) repeat protein